MLEEQTDNIIAQISTYIAENTMATILIFVAGILVILLLIYIISRVYRNSELMKYEFITIFAHKFHTPLTHIKWLSEGLMNGEQDQYKLESLRDLHKANEQLIKLSGTLIELTDSNSKSKKTYNFERINLCDLVRSALSDLKDVIHEKNLFLSVQYPPADVFVKADKTRMEFVLQTLIQNACTYTPPGRNIGVFVTLSHRKVIVSISDNGIGIEKKDMPHIFTKFYRTQNAQETDTEGFGIGLFLAKSIVDKHRGKIEVFSDGLNQGTTFNVTLHSVK